MIPLTTSPSQPPHPKFLLIPKRYASIRLHLLSGTVEIAACVAGLVAHYANGASVLPYIQVAGPAGLVHAVTAVLQTRLTFGAKLLMRPAYYVISVMHGVSAAACLAYPASAERLLKQYLILCIFTWGRVYLFTLLYVLKFMEDVVYTISILLAGLTIFPFVIGPMGIFLGLCYFTLCGVLWRWSLGVSMHDPQWAEVTQERRGTELFNAPAMAAWRGIGPNATKEESRAAALRAFCVLDSDGSGTLDECEAAKLLQSLHVHAVVRRTLLRTLQVGAIDFPTFERAIWNLGRRGDASAALDHHSVAELKELQTDAERAMAVFANIDLDGSGVLEDFELAELLVQWGCPDDEVTAYIKAVDDNGDGRISFAEFYSGMKVIWSFGYTILLSKAQEREKSGFSLLHAEEVAATPRLAESPHESELGSPSRRSLRLVVLDLLQETPWAAPSAGVLGQLSSRLRGRSARLPPSE